MCGARLRRAAIPTAQYLSANYSPKKAWTPRRRTSLRPRPSAAAAAARARHCHRGSARAARRPRRAPNQAQLSAIAQPSYGSSAAAPCASVVCVGGAAGEISCGLLNEGLWKPRALASPNHLDRAAVARWTEIKVALCVQQRHCVPPHPEGGRGRGAGGSVLNDGGRAREEGAVGRRLRWCDCGVVSTVWRGPPGSS